MTPKNARKLVAKVLPGYQVKTAPKAMPMSDAAKGSAVEVVSPSLRNLKRRYFGRNAAAAQTQVAPDSADSGIVIVQKAGAKSGKAVVFSKGKIIGQQG